MQLHRRRCGGDWRCCGGCDDYFPLSQLSQHQPQCILRDQQAEADAVARMQREREQMRQSGLLTDAQLKALQHVTTQAAQLSKAAEPALIDRFNSLGYDEHHMRRVLRFIREHCPVLIHVNLSQRSAVSEQSQVEG